MDKQQWRCVGAWYAGGAALSGGVAVALLEGGPGLAVIPVGWVLLGLAIIDIRVQLLPDRLTLPLLVAGLLAAALGMTIEPLISLAGAVVGYLGMMLMRHGYRYSTGREGLGGGDAKLVAALGSWLGVTPLLPLLEWSSLMGLAGGLVVYGVRCRCKWRRGVDRSPLNGDVRLPFGPCLALTGWILLLTAMHERWPSS